MEGAAASALDPRASPRCLRATDGSPSPRRSDGRSRQASVGPRSASAWTSPPPSGLHQRIVASTSPPPANRCFDLACAVRLPPLGPRLRRPAVSAWTSPPLGPSGLPASAANTEAERRGGYGPVSLPRAFCLRPPVSAFAQTSRGQCNQRSDATVRNGGKEGRVGMWAGMFVVRRASTLRLRAVRGYSGGYLRRA